MCYSVRLSRGNLFSRDPHLQTPATIFIPIEILQKGVILKFLKHNKNMEEKFLPCLTGNAIYNRYYI